MSLKSRTKYLFGSFIECADFYFKPGFRREKYSVGFEDRRKRHKWLNFIFRWSIKRGLRRMWYEYFEIVKHGDVDKIEFFLSEIEKMLISLEKGSKKYHLGMSKEEEEISIKKIAMELCYEIGTYYECKKKYNEALKFYDKGAQLLDRNNTKSDSLVGTQNRIYDGINNLFRKSFSETGVLYDVLLTNVIPSNNIMPWTLMVLGTKLSKEGKKVRLMDGYFEDNDILKEAGNSRLIGLSVMTSRVGQALKLSRLIKKIYPDKFIVWGGVHPTLFPEQCLQEDAIDFVIYGDGEDAVSLLVDSLKGCKISFSEIEGLGYKTDNRIVLNPLGKPVRFDNAGPWEFELFDMRHYMNWNVMQCDYKYPSMSLMATRGCPKGCTFCINSVVKHTRMHRARSVDSVLDEVENLIRKYKARTITFPDEAFFINPKYFESFVDGVQKRNLKFEWGMGCHIADILKHKELLINAKKAGLISIGGSGESGSDRILKLLKKDITVEQVKACMHFLADNGFMTAGCFMTHLPTETIDERKSTIDLISYCKNVFRKKGLPSYIMGPAVFRPYPGSILYNMCLESGFKEPKRLEDWEKAVRSGGDVWEKDMTWLG